MKAINRLLFVAVALAIVAAPAMAQCPTGAETFASVGGMMTNALRIDATGTAGFAGGTSIGRFWQSNDSNSGNSFGGGCPASSYVLDQSANANCLSGNCIAINGGVAAANCTANTCPDSAITLVVEDYDAGGPPGVNGTAYYIALRTPKDDPANTSGRRWDLALPTPGGPTQTGYVPLNEFPRAFVLSAAKVPGGVDTDQQLADAGAGAYSVDLGVTPLPDSSVVNGYDICTFTGNGDPGRDRALWVCGATLPYLEGADLVANVPVDCASTVTDTYVAIGLSFNGGAGPAVPSGLVGQATVIECDPNIAEPQKPIHRPQIGDAKKSKRPARSGR